jgi:hypothetical protein
MDRVLPAALVDEVDLVDVVDIARSFTQSTVSTPSTSSTLNGASYPTWSASYMRRVTLTLSLTLTFFQGRGGNQM